VPSYIYLQAIPYQMRRSFKTSMTPIELPGKFLYTQKLEEMDLVDKIYKGLGARTVPR
jgi:hypothetical protein